MPYLAFNLNDGNEFIFDLLEDRLSLGRNPRNEIVIDNNQISSFHAEFARQSGGAYVLTDLKSSNGTYVNGQRVESAELKPGDKVSFGLLEARFRDSNHSGSDTGGKSVAIPKNASVLSQIVAKNPSPSSDDMGVRQEMQEQLGALKAEIAGAREQLRSLRDESANLEQVKKEAVSSKQELESLRQESEAARKQIDEQRRVGEKNHERIADEAKAAGERLADMTREIKAAEERLAALRKEGDIASAVSTKVAENSAQLEKLDGERAAMAREHGEYAARLGAAREEAAALTARRDERVRELGKLAAECTARENEHAEFIAKINSMQHEVERLAGQRDDHARELEKFSGLRAAKEAELSALAVKLSKAQQEFESHNRERVVHAKELESLATQRSAQEKDHASWLARIEAARQEHAAMMKQQAEAGARLQQARQLQAGAEARLHSLQPEQVKLETLINESNAELARQQKLRESGRRELDESIAKHRQKLEAIEREVVEAEGRRTAAEKRLEELAATESRQVAATKALKLLVDQQSAAESALAGLKSAHEQARRQMDETTAGNAEARKSFAEIQHKLSLLQDEKTALEESAAKARVALVEVEKNFAEKQAGLEKSHAIKIKESEATLATKQSAIDAAHKRLKELEARSADLETKTARLAEVEKKLAEARDKITGHESKQAELQQLIAELTAQRGEREAEIGSLSAECDRRNGEIKGLIAREEGLKKTAGDIQAEVAAGRSRFEELRKLNAEAELNFSTRRSELERDLADKENNALAIEERVTGLMRREEALNARMRELSVTESRLKEAEKALSLAEEQKRVLEGVITALARQRDEKEHEYTAMAEQGDAQHALTRTLAKQRAGLEENVASLERTAEAAAKRLTEIESRATELEGKSVAHQAELEKARAGVAQAAADLQTHRAEMLEVANAKDRHLAEHKDVKSKHAALVKLLEETAVRHRAAESRTVAAEGEAKKQQARLDSLAASVAEKSTEVAGLEKRHTVLTEAAAKFAAEEAARRESLARLEKQLGETAVNLEAKSMGLAEAEKRLSAAELKCLELEQRLVEHREIEQRIIGARESLAATRATESDVRAKTEVVRKEREALHQDLLQLRNEAAAQGQSLATLRREHETEKLRLQQTRDHLELENKRAGGVRNEITVLMATLASRQKDAQDAVKQAEEAAERLTVLERSANELKGVEQQILKAQESLDSISKQRLEELQAFDALTARTGALSQELVRIEHEIADEEAREAMAAEAARRREGELAELEDRAAAARENLAHVEQVHAGVVQELQAARSEAESIRATSVAVGLEAAATQNTLSELVARRTAEEQNFARLSAQLAGANLAVGETTRTLNTLREQYAQGEESLRKISDQMSLEGNRLAMAQSGVEATEKRLADLQEDLGGREAMLTGQVAELTKQVENLRREEDGIGASLQTNRERLQRGEASLEELMGKIAANEARCAELLRSGDKLLSINEALAMMETKEIAASRRLSEVAEQELSLEGKLNALKESIANEQQHLEQLRRERAQEEEDRAAALEKARRDLDEAKLRAGEELKQTEIELTTKLKERVGELEEKHEILRRSLHAGMDERTVILFANDLIKRIDLIDILIQRVTGPGINGGMDQQLRTLRASFEDILEQHGIAEFKVAPGTEVDVDLRQRIAIVESVSGPARPRVVESYRPGFRYSGEDGREVVLRKVEVKTSSE